MESFFLSEYFVVAIFLFAGLFALVSSVFNFNWYFNSRKASAVVGLLGRTGARVFYGIMGIILIICALYLFLRSRY